MLTDGRFRRGPGNLVRVAIVSGVRLYREGLALALRPHTGVEVVGSVAGPGEMLAAVQTLQPDVLLIDLALEDDAALVRRLLRQVTVPVVILGVTDDDSDILTWAETGIAGFVTRDGTLGDLVAAVGSAARGEFLCSPAVAYGLLRRVSELAARAGAPAPPVHLTLRELQIMDLVDQGRSNKEIAAHLGVAVSTVKNHMHNILEKLQVPTRHQAALAARSSQRSPGLRSGWTGDPVPRRGSAVRD